MKGVRGMSKKSVTVHYAVIQAFHWMTFAAIFGYVSVFLLDSGFSNSEIGILIAIAGIVSAVAQPAIASYADSPGSISLKKLVLLLGVALILAAAGLLLFPGSRMLTALSFGGCLALLPTITPLMNAIGISNVYEANFGIARGIGAAAYGAGALILGVAVKQFGTAVVAAFTVLTFAGFCAAIVFYPFRKAQAQKDEKTASVHPSAFMRRYPMFALVLVGYTLIYISHVFLNSFTYQIVCAKGGSSSEMGTAMAVASLMELPVMFLFSLMTRRISCGKWFRLTGIFFFLKTLGTLLAPSMTVFYAVQVLQMFGWGLASVCSVYYINSIMDAEDAVKGQAYFTMTYTVGSVLGATAGGWLIDGLSVPAMLLFGTVSAGIGAAIVFYAVSNKKASVCA